jgi:hypothetical protein
MRASLFIILFIITLFINPLTGFSQCSTTNVLTENFNDNTANTLDAGQTKGAYAASCGGNVDISNNADACCAAGPDSWKTSTSTPPTGNDGGGTGDYALLIDGCGSVPNGSVWCTSVTVAPGEIYDFSAFYSSPWLEEKANDPALYLTINGVTISPGAIVEQYTASGATPYQQQACYYTIPAGTSGSVQFCINMNQVSSGVYGTASSQGNDFMVDDIVINRRSGGGCPASGTCTYPGTIVTPVELVSLSVRKDGNNAALQWITASEQNSSYFSIEKSDDGIYFTGIGTVNAQGNSSNLVTYEFEDNHFNASAYYRLKMVDKDGSYKYSRIAVLKKDEYARIINRSDEGQLEIKAMITEDARWNIAVYSLLGQQYLNETVRLVKGESTILKEIGGAEQGAKIVRITGEDGTVILSQVVVW